MTTRIKICGITRLQDALLAEELGVDALGFVFVAASKRHITLASAVDIASQLGPFSTRVGLFLNAPRVEVEQAIDAMPDLLPQFHGQETAEYCDSFARPYLKAIGVASGMPEAAVLESYRNASGFLFDSNEAGELGGTGHTFDWELLTRFSGRSLILAGGLGPANIKTAIAQVHPHAVDVSTGVEQAKGIKDPDLMRQFVEQVKAVG